MVIRKVTIAAGADFTDVLATIPAHQMKFKQDPSDAVQKNLEIKRFEDAFAVTYTEFAGAEVTLTGPGADGILRRPPNYNATGYPATGEAYVKVRASDGTEIHLVVTEAENQIVG